MSSPLRQPSCRWFVIGVFVLSTSINMLDRQVLTAAAPSIKTDFHLTGIQYGALISAFALAYAICAPVTGWLIDRVGLNWGVSLAVGVWSLAGIASGLSRSLGSLASCRALLGAGESGGMPALAKANANFLPPSGVRAQLGS